MLPRVQHVCMMRVVLGRRCYVYVNSWLKWHAHQGEQIALVKNRHENSIVVPRYKRGSGSWTRDIKGPADLGRECIARIE